MKTTVISVVTRKKKQRLEAVSGGALQFSVSFPYSGTAPSEAICPIQLTGRVVALFSLNLSRYETLPAVTSRYELIQLTGEGAVAIELENTLTERPDPQVGAPAVHCIYSAHRQTSPPSPPRPRVPVPARLRTGPNLCL